MAGGGRVGRDLAAPVAARVGAAAPIAGAGGELAEHLSLPQQEGSAADIAPGGKRGPLHERVVHQHEALPALEQGGNALLVLLGGGGEVDAPHVVEDDGLVLGHVLGTQEDLRGGLLDLRGEQLGIVVEHGVEAVVVEAVALGHNERFHCHWISPSGGLPLFVAGGASWRPRRALRPSPPSAGSC